jgi:MFS family permease
MLKKTQYSISELGTKKTLTGIILVANAVIWYYAGLSFLENLVTKISPGPSAASITIWSLHFSGLIISALAGALSAQKIGRNNLLIIWMTLGVTASLSLLAANTSNVILVSLIGLFIGMSLGFGMPTCMNYFSDKVSIENRGRTSGVTLLASGIGIVIFRIVTINSPLILGVILAVWRLSSLAIFLSVRPSIITKPKNSISSYKNIISQPSFILYFIPWLMFSLVNFLVAPLDSSSGSDISGNISLIQTGLLGIFAVIGGFWIDSIGRKPIAILGFAMLGIGTAVLGISTTNSVILYFNAVIDGIAWGFLLVLFILTIWGDLSYSSTSDKFYAIGASPFFVSMFLYLTVHNYISKNLSTSSALFSFGAVFLFLAVLPLFYASETLPEKNIKKREIQSYADKAKKYAEKYT